MLKIYNTQARKKQEFIPVEDGNVKMYVCGPTVYNRIHIGNARTFLCFDIIRRYLIYKGFKVTYVQNLTDVDDKIIKKAQECDVAASEISNKFSNYFIEDMHKSNVLDPDFRPYATKEIDSMIDLIQNLVDKGHAYVMEGNVYFDVESYKNYGSLSGRDIESSETGHRTLQAESSGVDIKKQSDVDFALWKSAKAGEPSWSSPWGEGRPGWHIECSAMSQKYLGLPFDIHGGGSDLIFPHHENEQAQSVCGYGSKFVNYWMHTGMLQIVNDAGEPQKMSKSLNNFILLHNILDQTGADVLRMLILQTHYRSPLVYSKKRLDEAKQSLTRIKTSINNIKWAIENASDAQGANDDAKSIAEQANMTKENFILAMDDDFNTSQASGEIFSFINFLNKNIATKNINRDTASALNSALGVIYELMGVFGIDLNGNNDSNNKEDNVFNSLKDLVGLYCQDNVLDVDEALNKLCSIRIKAKKQKDFKTADDIRDKLKELNIILEDTPQGTRIIK